MKAILKEDIIINFDNKAGTEIGALIPNVGLERMRFIGDKIVDLADLKEMWIRPISSDSFELHAIEVPNSQKIKMRYKDRKKLRYKHGKINVLTQDDEFEEKIKSENDLRENQFLSKEVISMLNDLSYNKIDSHIENVFKNLNDAQKLSLKRLYKIVLYLAKKFN